MRRAGVQISLKGHIPQWLGGISETRLRYVHQILEEALHTPFQLRHWHEEIKRFRYSGAS
jgi:hypothetical protein